MKKDKHIVGMILAGMQGILSLVVLVLIFMLKMLPTTYLIIAVISLAALFAFALFSQFKKQTHIIGKIIAVFMCIVLAAGSYYLVLTNKLLSNATSNDTQIDNVIAVVMDNDPAQTIQDAANYEFGILESTDRDLVDLAVTSYNETVNKTLSLHTYEGISDMLTAFLNGEVQALIYNEPWTDSMEELEEDFSSKIRILNVFEIETEPEETLSDIDVSIDPFVVYISGNDKSGALATRGRSDVNMMAVVNPNTKQILLIVTPRDYYVEFPGITGGTKDKLTHAGNYGVQVSIDTLASIYDVDIEHYFRLNFTSFVEIVDALGGINVYSEYAFTSRHGSYTFHEGYNTMNGNQALGFSRERYNLSEGDFQRGKNQQAVMTAMIRKALSPSILTGYAGIVSGLEGNIDMSFSQDDIAALVKMQLNDGRDWKIVSVAAGGSTSSEYCYSLRNNASVVIPDYDSVAEIKQKIQQVYNGELLEEATTY